jgi:antitoxin (DNA-binding transcriptional repressor) of toxin-antitoxin stability system
MKKPTKTQFTIYETRTHLSRLLKRVERGEELVIANGKRVVARLVPAFSSPQERQPGSARNAFKMGADFDAPLPEDFTQFFK